MTETAAREGIPAPTLRVVGPGFGRTGTMSMRAALERLGFAPCDHMLENLEHPERFALWEEALQSKRRGRPIDWRPLLTGFRAIVDWPGAYFWRELSAAHPGAKVILTVRDPDRWYDSIQATIFSMVIEAGPDEPLMDLWEDTFGGRLADRAHCQAVFNRHNQAVCAAIVPERLLVFDVKEGWGPLCAFLDVPIPVDEPFPHANDAAAFKKEIQEKYGSTPSEEASRPHHP